MSALNLMVPIARLIHQSQYILYVMMGVHIIQMFFIMTSFIHNQSVKKAITSCHLPSFFFTCLFSLFLHNPGWVYAVWISSVHLSLQIQI